MFARIGDTRFREVFPFASVRLAKIPVISWKYVHARGETLAKRERDAEREESRDGRVERGCKGRLYPAMELYGHEFIPRSAISISYPANVSSCLANVLRHPFRSALC